MLTHILTPTDCATCKLCCNFHRDSAWETPSLEPEQISLFQERGIPLEKRADGSCSFCLFFQADEACNCPVLDTDAGCTLPRSKRPFECRIWPLRLMKDGQQLVLGLYSQCPALSSPTLQKLIAYATGELLPAILQHGQRHPSIIRPLNPAYKVIWRDNHLFHVEH